MVKIFFEPQLYVHRDIDNRRWHLGFVGGKGKRFREPSGKATRLDIIKLDESQPKRLGLATAILCRIKNLASLLNNMMFIAGTRVFALSDDLISEESQKKISVNVVGSIMIVPTHNIDH